MKTHIAAAISCSLMFIAVTGSLVSVQPAQAYTVTLEQLGSNVVANGKGAIDVNGLTFLTNGRTIAGFISPVDGRIRMGSPGLYTFTAYTGDISGPSSFGSGDPVFANTGSGDFVGIEPGFDGVLFLPGFNNAPSLSGRMIFNDATFASLGVTPGTYVWRWGPGANQRFTLIIGGAGVPDGGSTVSLLGCALLGLTALRRKLKLLKPIS